MGITLEQATTKSENTKEKALQTKATSDHLSVWKDGYDQDIYIYIYIYTYIKKDHGNTGRPLSNKKIYS